MYVNVILKLHVVSPLKSTDSAASCPSIFKGREPEFLRLATKFTFDVVMGAKLLMMFPSTLRKYVVRSTAASRRVLITCLVPSLVGELVTSVPSTTRHAMKFLAPVIQERLQKIRKFGKDYPHKPVKLIMFRHADITLSRCFRSIYYPG